MTPTPRMDFLSRRIHLVTGKGGVGRTTVAAALATAAAGHGKRVLLAEIGDPEGGYSPIGRRFGRDQLAPDPEPLGPEGLRGCHVFATRGHELFAHSVIPAGPLIRAALRSKALRKFVTAVPSLYELGVFYHLLTLLQAVHEDGRPEHEIIVADMPATGQTIALTSLPEILLDALPDGPIPRYMRQGQAYLNDPAKGVAWIVTLPEFLPVTEAFPLVGFTNIVRGLLQSATGSTLSFTVTVASHVLELPSTSVTVRVTVFVPTSPQPNAVVSNDRVSIPHVALDPLSTFSAAVDPIPKLSSSTVTF